MNDFPCKLTLRIDWSEIDLFGHVNNLAILKYVQAARVNYLEAVGLMQSQAEAGIGPILALTGCQFRKPLFYPGQVTVYSKVDYIKNSSFQLRHLIYNDHNEIAAEARDIIVLYDFTKNVKVAISNELRGKFERLERRKFINTDSNSPQDGMLKIINAKEYPGGIGAAVDYIHGKWGNENNYAFYKDAIYNSSLPGKPLPQFFLLLKNEKTIGCSALISNDFISRHDLYPWLACLYVDQNERGNEYGKLLIEHTVEAARQAGFSAIYLTTDHDGYYEKYGWKRIEDGIDLFTSKPTRIYARKLI